MAGTGKGFVPDAVTGAPYVVLEYCDRMDLAYAAADLVWRGPAPTRSASSPPSGCPRSTCRCRSATASSGSTRPPSSPPAEACSSTTPPSPRPGSVTSCVPSPSTPTALAAMAAAAASVGERGGDELLADLVVAAARGGRTMTGPDPALRLRRARAAARAARPGAPHRHRGGRHVGRRPAPARPRPAGQRLRRGRRPHAAVVARQRCPVSTSATTRPTSPTSTPSSCRRRSATTTSSSPPRAPRACGCCTAPRRSRRSWAARAGSRSPAPTARPRRPRCSSSPSPPPGPTPRSPRAARSRSSAPTPPSAAAPAFVVEADESDGSFLTYRPDVAVVTNVQPDHLDFYGTVEAVEQAYAAFVESVTDGGLARRLPRRRRVAAARRRGARRRRTVLTYGHAEGADLRVGAVTSHDLGTRSVFVHDGVEQRARPRGARATTTSWTPAPPTSPPCGLGADPQAVLAGLAGFRGARRRFEVRGEVGGVTVVDDYAHNPAKVAAVVGTASDIVHRAGHGSLRVVFQPHLYSRTRDFADRLRPGPGAGRPGRAPRRLRRARATRRGRHLRPWSATRCAPCPAGARCSSGPPATRPSRRWPTPPGPATSCSPSGPATSPPSAPLLARGPARPHRRASPMSLGTTRRHATTTGVSSVGQPRSASGRCPTAAAPGAGRWSSLLAAAPGGPARSGSSAGAPGSASTTSRSSGSPGPRRRPSPGWSRCRSAPPLARVDTEAVGARVRERVTVAEVSVRRSWPGTLTVEVVPRSAALVVRNPQGRLEVVDAEGVTFGTVAGRSQGRAGGHRDRRRGHHAARPCCPRSPCSTRCPPSWPRKVSGIKVSSANLITFTLGRRTVVWGGGEDSARKVAILTALLQDQGEGHRRQRPGHPGHPLTDGSPLAGGCDGWDWWGA